ncbi:hypothetical protein DFH11DRAFT_1688448 [Phellopilus nigrolimitatus]|nr:hypothetical protein DFH11DRAFT_1688448 [Phellopilus nigrolimitatus]
MSFRSQDNPKRNHVVDIADTTLLAIDRGSYIVQDVGEIYLSEAVARCTENTRLYGPDSVLSSWPNLSSTSSLVRGQLPEPGPSMQSAPSDSVVSIEKEGKECKIIILQISTLAGARLLATTTSRPGGNAIETEREENKIGILNFASAKHPGGGFLKGAQAQEESIARSSTLYSSLMSPVAKPFYQTHRHDPQAGYYSHTMIYSPNVLLLRDDDGSWQRPVCADVLTSPAVNAKVVRQSVMGRLAAKSETAKIDRVMRERAARALYAFERHGVRHLVLGAWGCGVFENDVRAIATIWADLLGREDSRFRRSFDRVVFAVLGENTFKEFEAAFTLRAQGDCRYTYIDGDVSVPNLQRR